MNQMSRITSAEPTSYRARFSTSEFLRMIEVGAFGDMHVELVEGALERMPPPGNDHGAIQSIVVIALAAVVNHRLIRGEVGVTLGEDTILGCDAAVLRAPVQGRRMLAPEDVLLAIEVSVSTQARDLGLKRRLYAAAGIAHYWAIDAERSVVHVHAEPVEGEYVAVHSVRFGEPLAVPGTDRAITID